MRSITDLGASTKLSGAIGRKGIGFKSVFMVSDTPHILSGPWSFTFDVAKHGKYGYVVPIWVDRPRILRQLPEAARRELARGGSTCIWLPRSKLDLRGDLRAELLPDPACLLFLRKIKQIAIEDAGFRRRLRVRKTPSWPTETPTSALYISVFPRECMPQLASSGPT